ncbi:MAG: enoyl-CoA hydratase/isomerase family protein [Actinomycetes bacterium]
MIETTRNDDVFVLRMVAEENRFNPTMLAAFTEALDQVEASDGPAAVVLTGEGKFFSNGLDLDWMMANAGEGGPSLVVNGLQALYSRLLTFPTPTIAAVNGHAFAGGGMLALACDQRVMRDDRGFFCLPEVDINIPFTKGMSLLVQARLTPSVARDVMMTGRRYTAEESLAAGIVDATASEDQVVSQAIERAQALAGKDRGTLGTIKRTMFAEVTEALAEQVSF